MPPATEAVAESVSVLVPEPATLVGLNVPVAPEGSPLRVRETVPVNPPVAVTVIVLVPLAPPAVTVVVPEEVLIVKPGGICTTKVIVVVRTTPALVPLMVRGYDPTGVFDPVVIVSVLVPVPVSDVGLNVALAPVGSDEMLKLIALENPPSRVALIV